MGAIAVVGASQRTRLKEPVHESTRAERLLGLRRNAPAVFAQNALARIAIVQERRTALERHVRSSDARRRPVRSSSDAFAVDIKADGADGCDETWKRARRLAAKK